MHQRKASVTIDRPRSEKDWQRIREICCETARSGLAIDDRSRWDFFGRLWVGPYEKYEPGWAYIARGDDERILGYLTGCPDTQRFERLRKTIFNAMLFFSILLGQYRRNEDTRRFIKRFLGLEKDPNLLFSEKTRATIRDHYPAHLHINFAQEARGMGLGRKLIEAYFADLSGNHVRGVHLYCGPAPVEFYKKVGMELLEEIALAGGARIFAMGRRFG